MASLFNVSRVQSLFRESFSNFQAEWKVALTEEQHRVNERIETVGQAIRTELGHGDILEGIARVRSELGERIDRAQTDWKAPSLFREAFRDFQAEWNAAFAEEQHRVNERIETVCQAIRTELGHGDILEGIARVRSELGERIDRAQTDWKATLDADVAQIRDWMSTTSSEQAAASEMHRASAAKMEQQAEQVAALESRVRAVEAAALESRMRAVEDVARRVCEVGLLGAPEGGGAGQECLLLREDTPRACCTDEGFEVLQQSAGAAPEDPGGTISDRLSSFEVGLSHLEDQINRHAGALEEIKAMIGERIPDPCRPPSAKHDASTDTAPPADADRAAQPEERVTRGSAADMSKIKAALEEIRRGLSTSRPDRGPGRPEVPKLPTHAHSQGDCLDDLALTVKACPDRSPSGRDGMPRDRPNVGAEVPAPAPAGASTGASTGPQLHKNFTQPPRLRSAECPTPLGRATISCVQDTASVSRRTSLPSSRSNSQASLAQPGLVAPSGTPRLQPYPTMGAKSLSVHVLTSGGCADQDGGSTAEASSLASRVVAGATPRGVHNDDQLTWSSATISGQPCQWSPEGTAHRQVWSPRWTWSPRVTQRMVMRQSSLGTLEKSCAQPSPVVQSPAAGHVVWRSGATYIRSPK